MFLVVLKGLKEETTMILTTVMIKSIFRNPPQTMEKGFPNGSVITQRRKEGSC